jgi:UDP-N-acetylglucosamine diphosphorylase / glucose-1-phosphate thymidylyltransferase / UDP-N-acetylgalactosamine diphosphorylase / glucosamine-1-phosphate N-acetyltransferase / galactosamine-1-phosphate N-acetyltransferase
LSLKPGNLASIGSREIRARSFFILVITLLSSSLMFAPSNFLNLDQTEHRTIFDNSTQVWDVLKQIGSYLQFRLKPAVHGRVMGRPFISENVYVGGGTMIENGATIKGPAWIGNDCEIRSGCYIRENVIIGDGVVLGNSCEFKNCIVFNDAEIPHFSYVGDSVLGYQVHLGAGVILSNVRLDRKEISVKTVDNVIPTGLRKFGAIVGDRAEIGCNTVISPGSIIGRHSLIYPLTHFGGVLPENTVLKMRQDLLRTDRH